MRVLRNRSWKAIMQQWPQHNLYPTRKETQQKTSSIINKLFKSLWYHTNITKSELKLSATLKTNPNKKQTKENLPPCPRPIQRVYNAIRKLIKKSKTNVTR